MMSWKIMTNIPLKTSSGCRKRPGGLIFRPNAKQPAIGKLIDDAMVAIEKENPKLKGVLLKDCARPTLDKHTLGELIDLIGKSDTIYRCPQDGIFNRLDSQGTF